MAIKWSDWTSRGKPHETEISRPFAQRNQDGRLEIFAVGGGAVFNLAQVSPNGGWREAWLSKDRPPTGDVKSHVVGNNADGRLEIFAIGSDGALWQKWQVAPNSGWSEWKTLGTPGRDIAVSEQFTAGRNQDGRQEVFTVGNGKEPLTGLLRRFLKGKIELNRLLVCRAAHMPNQ